ncbi:ribonuclease H-like [Panicum miliaceum]|uniref:Ribonuclease H n=1 Tax=Panicum miliaceum TaxID=4540 RepID=A0A3L6QKK6_PANMI|nr:ribonuclease H-like [Panicum miliaceum]
MGTQGGPAFDGNGRGEASTSGKRKRGLSEEEGQMYGGLIKTNMTWYVVFWGRKPGVYGDWGLCQAQISGFSNANYKKYKTMEEAVHVYESFVLATRGTLEHQIPENAPGTTQLLKPTSSLQNSGRM